MRTVLLFATTTGYQTRSFAEAAEKIGVRLVLATDRCDQLDDPWRDRAVPVRFHDEERSVQAVLEAVAGALPTGVLVVGDRPVGLAACVAQALGLNGNSPEAAAATRNKLMSRLALKGAGLPVPWFEAFPADARPQDIAGLIPYPCVVKPLAQSGSRGVIRANHAAEFVEVFARVQHLLQFTDVRAERDPAHDAILVESFIPGREHAVEALLEDGRIRVLAVFDKPDPLDGPFFEETIYVTPTALTREADLSVRDAVSKAAHALGLRHGPVHAECRVNDDGVYVLEVAGRPIGGLCSRALRFVQKGSGVICAQMTPDPITLEELLLRHAVGESTERFTREPSASGVMMIPIPRRGIYKGVSGVDAATTTRHVEEVLITAKPDVMLVPLPEGKSYLGFIFARAASAGEVVDALRAAHAHLEFAIDRAVPVVK